MGWFSGFKARRKYSKMYRQARQACRNGEYEKSLLFYKELLSFVAGMWGCEDTRTAKIYDGIGCVYLNQHQYDLALEYFDKAMVFLKAISPQHVLLAQPIMHKGIVYVRLNDFETAVECYEEAIGIQKQYSGPFAANVTMTTRQLLDYARTKRDQLHQEGCKSDG